MEHRSGGGLPRAQPARQPPGEGSLRLGQPWVAPRGKPLPTSLLSLPQVDRTEVVGSCLHPAFSKVFTLEYCFAEAQRLRFEVYDSHGPSGISCQDDDFLGGVECTLGQVGTPSPQEGGGRGGPAGQRSAWAGPEGWCCAAGDRPSGSSGEHPGSAVSMAPFLSRSLTSHF